MHTQPATPILFLAFANDRARHLRNLPEEASQPRAILEEPAFSLKYQPEIRENLRRDQLLRFFQHSRNHNRIALFHFGGPAHYQTSMFEFIRSRGYLSHKFQHVDED
ncbi:MAG TPA: hypothetical protein PKE45_16945 [Caldilineaceae bacterium]|nr:hypothetical protein [Caldilineaceae bacterium]